MTTVAIGFCTSAPAPVATAIGTKPSDATSAVIATGRSRSIAPCRTASSRASPSPRSCGTVQRLGVYAASAHGRPEPGDGSNSWPKPEPSAPL